MWSPATLGAVRVSALRQGVWAAGDETVMKFARYLQLLTKRGTISRAGKKGNVETRLRLR